MTWHLRLGLLGEGDKSSVIQCTKTARYWHTSLRVRLPHHHLYRNSIHLQRADNPCLREVIGQHADGRAWQPHVDKRPALPLARWYRGPLLHHGETATLEASRRLTPRRQSSGIAAQCSVEPEQRICGVGSRPMGAALG